MNISLFPLYPQPRKLELREGSGSFSADFALESLNEEARRAESVVRVKDRLEAVVARRQGSASDIEGAESLGSVPATILHIACRPELHTQGYTVEWNGERLEIGYSAVEGLHYAVVTLEQLITRQGIACACFRIEDEPDFPVRGLMLDIGRNKIPKMETLYPLIDRMSELKMNHLQLYMEGFCFDYESFRDSFPEATPISGAEFRELDAYAKERFIDLVPNQNCLGHMGPWLAKPEFADLAEHPGGQETPVSIKLPPLTLNPLDSRSIDLVRTMFGELLPHFTSEYVNVNMDEPFGLGKGQSKERAQGVGVGKVYMDYAEQVFEIIRSHGKRTLMWGDILTKHDEIIPLLPKDVTVLDWNYESHTSFEANGKLLQRHGVPYYVCPGTSTWSSITGRTDNMLTNIADAARSGKAYGAAGMIVTDWGDSGHWQPLVMSYPAYAYAAGTGWQTEANLEQHEQLERYVTDCMLQDDSGHAGKLILELGRYINLENSTLENMTYTNHLLNRGLSTKEKLLSETDMIIKLLVEIGGRGIPFQLDYRSDDMLAWLKEQKDAIGELRLKLGDAEIVSQELAHAISLIEHGSGLHRFIFGLELPDGEAELAWLRNLHSELASIIAEFDRLWLIRNRKGGLEASTRNLHKLLKQYEDRLAELENA
ncbi:family 20 glycosylhydrolase [Paenibacillus sp. NPDC057967]|uniref:beta-N-acetylhexosaminidase n=1 Tax=Paenibacillus sp. NPDC057967 TaxID=3346293 RepID=UPI0036DBD845